MRYALLSRRQKKKPLENSQKCMDAPVLPPSQDNIPAIVTSATEPAQPPFIPALLGSASVWQVVYSNQVSAYPLQGGSHGLLAPTTAPLDLGEISTSASFWTWPQLANSFGFVERTLRATQIDSAKRDQSSAAVLIGRSPRDSWQSSTAAAEINVKRVDLTPEQVAAENGTWAEAFREKCLAYGQSEPAAGPLYQISLREQTLGYVAGEGRAYLLAEQLKRLLRQDSFEPEAIAPAPTAPDTDSASPGLMVSADGRELFAITPSMTESVGYGPEWAAISWANNLRVALAAEPLGATEAQLSLKGLRASEASLSGEASWYGPYFHGRTTANGETFNQNALTVAHKSLPFGTQLQVRNLSNDQTVIVRVNDRGPYVGDRSLDLSKAAARCLGSEQVGVIPYEAVILKEAQPLAVAAES